MATTKYIIKADVSNALSNIDKLKLQYKATLQDIIKNQELLRQKDRDIAKEKARQVTLTPRTQEMKESRAIEATLKRERSAYLANNTALKRNIDNIKAKILAQNESIKSSKDEIRNVEKITSAKKQEIRALHEKIKLKKQERLEEQKANSKAYIKDLKAKINARKLYNKELEATKKNLLIYSKAEQIEASYANKIKRVRELRKQGIITILEETRAIRNLNKAKREDLYNTKSMINGIVRNIRMIESFIVAGYGLYSLYNKTIGVGHEFNKVLENETAGLKILAVQNLKDTDALNRKITLIEKYSTASQEAQKMLRLAIKINPETPYNLKDTIRTYKALFPQLIKYKASLEDIAKITQKMTILGKANNLGTDQFIKTIDTAFSGNMLPSQMKQTLNILGITNSLVKKWKEQGTLVEEVLKRLDNVDAKMSGISDSFDVAVSNFQTQWQILWGDLQKPMFDILKNDITRLSNYIKNNKEAIENTTKSMASYGWEFMKTSLFIYSGLKAQELMRLAMNKYNASLYRAKVRLIEYGRANKIAVKGLTTVRKRTLLARLEILNLGKSLKKITMNNIPMLAIIAAFEAFGYIVGRNLEKQEKLNSILHLQGEELKKITRYQAINNINILENGLIEERQKLNELQLQLKTKGLIYDHTSKEAIAIRANIDAQKQKIKEYTNQISKLKNITDETKKAKEAIYKTSDGAKKTGDELKRNAEMAYRLADALDNASVSMRKALLEAKLINKDISKTQFVNIRANIDKKYLEDKLKDINKRYDSAKPEDIEKLNTSALKIATKIQRIKNKEASQELDILDKNINNIIELKGLELDRLAIIERNNKHNKKAIELEIKKIELQKKYLTNKLSTAPEDEKLKLQIQIQSLNNSILQKRYDLEKKVTNEIIKQNKKTSELYNILNGGINSILKGDFNSGIDSIFNGLVDKLTKPLANDLSKKISSILSFKGSGSSLANFGIGTAINIAGRFISELFSSSHLTDSQINKAKGKTDFSSVSLKELSSVINSSKNPLLPYTKKMVDLLDKMNINFKNISNNLVANGSVIDVTGSKYIPTLNKGFLGFSKEQRDLISSGINISTQDFMSAINNFKGSSYTTERVQKNSFWGLFSSDKIENKSSSIQNKTKQAFSSIFKNAYDVMLTSALELDLNKDEVKKSLKKVKIEIGKIDLKGLNDKEIRERINSAISQSLDGIVKNVEQFTGYIKKYNKEGEDSLKTLVRIATTYEQANYQFKIIGLRIKDYAKSLVKYTKQSQVLDIVEGAGGKDKFNSAIDSYITNFYSSQERYKINLKVLQDKFKELGVKLPKTKEEFRKLIQTMPTLNKHLAETKGKILALSSSFNNIKEAEKELLKEQKDKENELLQKQLAFEKDKLRKLKDFWTSSLSYLNSLEKIKKLESFKDGKNNSDIALKQLEYQLRTSRTKEDYVQYANKYIYDLRNKKPDATLKDVVKSNEDIKEEIFELRKKINEVSNLQIESDKEIASNTIEKLDKIEIASNSKRYGA